MAAALARGALSVCSRRCWARSTNWNVQTADCDVTKGPARLASPAGGAVTNPRLRIPPPRLLHGSLASGSYLGAQLRAAGHRPERRLLGAWVPYPRVTHRYLNEKSPTPYYGIPIFLHYLLISQNPHPSFCPPNPFTCILYPSPLICIPHSTHHIHAPPPSPLLVSLLALPFLSRLFTPPYTFSAFPLHYSSAGLV